MTLDVNDITLLPKIQKYNYKDVFGNIKPEELKSLNARELGSILWYNSRPLFDTFAEDLLTCANEDKEAKEFEESLNKFFLEFQANIINSTLIFFQKCHIEYLRKHPDIVKNQQELQKNGFYSRTLLTEKGKITLKVPRMRMGNFDQNIFDRFQRSSQALCTVVMELYVKGMSTRKIVDFLSMYYDKKNISSSLVSRFIKHLDPEIRKWRHRSLANKSYKYIYTDVLYIKVRENNVVKSKSFHVAVGIDENGYREILGTMISTSESEESWTRFFEHLKLRGLHGVKLIISDAHKGLVKAIEKCFVGCTWQRCSVHLERNVIAAMPQKNSKAALEELKSIFRYTDIDLAREKKNEFINRYGVDPKYSRACDILENGFEDAFQFTNFENGNKKLKSTNMIERLNEEIRRREKVVRIFPNDKAAIRLITSVLMDIDEKWMESNIRYIA